MNDPCDATKLATARIAQVWAAEVSPRIGKVKGNPQGGCFEQYMHALRDVDPIDDLTMLFYLVIDESRETNLANPWGHTEPQWGPRFDLGRSLKWLIRDTQVAAAPYSIQRETIPEQFADLPFEVIDDLITRVDWFRKGGYLHGLLRESQLAALDRVTEWIAPFLNEANERLWSEDAMQTEPEWTQARQLAAETLTLFGVDVPRTSSID